MHLVIETILYALLLLLCCTAFIAVLRYLLPRLFLGFRHREQSELGRGIKKYVYLQGRAVLYEPHPTVRKFIPQYLLYTKEGYKYLLLRTDAAVRSISYTLTMIGNTGKVLDVLSLKEELRSTPPQPFLLHADTSYVALSIREVNGLPLRPGRPYARSPWCLFGYAACHLAATFVFSILLTLLLARLLSIFDVGLHLEGHTASCLLVSLAMTALSLLMILNQDRKKGIGIARHGKS